MSDHVNDSGRHEKFYRKAIELRARAIKKQS